MINAKELRIGNWVDYKMQDGSYQSHPVFSLTITDSGKYENFSPIPLTSEILLKAGFEKDSKYYIKSIYYLGKDGDLFAFGERYQGHYANIKFVHQLQNLYFALTEIELEIKL